MRLWITSGLRGEKTKKLMVLVLTNMTLYGTKTLGIPGDLCLASLPSPVTPDASPLRILRKSLANVHIPFTESAHSRDALRGAAPHAERWGGIPEDVGAAACGCVYKRAIPITAQSISPMGRTFRHKIEHVSCASVRGGSTVFPIQTGAPVGRQVLRAPGRYLILPSWVGLGTQWQEISKNTERLKDGGCARLKVGRVVQPTISPTAILGVIAGSETITAFRSLSTTKCSPLKSIAARYVSATNQNLNGVSKSITTMLAAPANGVVASVFVALFAKTAMLVWAVFVMMCAFYPLPLSTYLRDDEPLRPGHICIAKVPEPQLGKLHMQEGSGVSGGVC